MQAPSQPPAPASNPCLQVVDPQKASYGVENAMYAVVQLAQTTMRSELGKITLDKTFEERQLLNHEIRCGAPAGVQSMGDCNPCLKTAPDVCDNGRLGP